MSGLEEISSDFSSESDELPSSAISGLEDISLDDVSRLEEKQHTASPSHMLVAAIDFGTTYSGYAFKMKHDGPKGMYIKSWNDGDGDFKSFGYQAEREYCDCENHKEWRFF